MLMAKVKGPKYPILDRRITRTKSVNLVELREKIFARALEKWHCDYKNILGTLRYINLRPNFKCEWTNLVVYFL